MTDDLLFEFKDPDYLARVIDDRVEENIKNFQSRKARTMTEERIFDFKDPDHFLDSDHHKEIKSATQAIIGEIDKSVVNARRQIFTNLVKDPGFLSTFGDDFVIEWSDFEIHTQQSVEDPLDDVTFSVHQKYRIRRRSTLEKDLIDQGLRQNPNGDLESV